MRSVEQKGTAIETFTELDHSYAETVAGLSYPNKRMPNTRRKQYKKVASYAQSHSESRETLRQTHNSVLLRRPSCRGDNREGHDSSDRRYASAYIPGLHSLRNMMLSVERASVASPPSSNHQNSINSLYRTEGCQGVRISTMRSKSSSLAPSFTMAFQTAERDPWRSRRRICS